MSSNDLDKYEYLTGEDLSLKLSTFERARFEYSPLGMSLSKVFKKDEATSVAKRKSDINYDSKYVFYRFCKGHGEIKAMSLDSKYNRMKEFNKFIVSFKNLKTKKLETQLKKDQIMKNVDELYKNYYNAYKSNYDTDDELKGDKKKNFDNRQFELDDKISKGSKLDEKTKELKLSDLPKWLSFRNDFNEEEN